jgi:RimJ/RimL family protein N-acetyltransferase
VSLAGWTPREPPSRAALTGRYVTLRPVDVADAEALYECSRDDAVWRYLGYGPWASAGEYRAWLEQAARSDDPLFLTVVVDGEPRGVVSYLRIDRANGVVEIGHIWYAPAIQRTRATTEVTYLLARHAFDDLGYRRFEWKCNAANAPSRAAAERFGFSYEGTFRQHMVVKGANRDTAWFALLDRDWPRVRQAFEDWLDPANFDDEGRQRRPLAARSAASASTNA